MTDEVYIVSNLSLLEHLGIKSSGKYFVTEANETLNIMRHIDKIVGVDVMYIDCLIRVLLEVDKKDFHDIIPIYSTHYDIGENELKNLVEYLYSIQDMFVAYLQSKVHLDIEVLRDEFYHGSINLPSKFLVFSHTINTIDQVLIVWENVNYDPFLEGV